MSTCIDAAVSFLRISFMQLRRLSPCLLGEHAIPALQVFSPREGSVPSHGPGSSRTSHASERTHPFQLVHCTSSCLTLAEREPPCPHTLAVSSRSIVPSLEVSRAWPVGSCSLEGNACPTRAADIHGFSCAVGARAMRPWLITRAPKVVSLSLPPSDPGTVSFGCGDPSGRLWLSWLGTWCFLM